MSGKSLLYSGGCFAQIPGSSPSSPRRVFSINNLFFSQIFREILFCWLLLVVLPRQYENAGGCDYM